MGRPAIAHVDFLQVPHTEVSEKFCVGDDIMEFMYNSSNSSTLDTLTRGLLCSDLMSG